MLLVGLYGVRLSVTFRDPIGPSAAQALNGMG